MLSNTHSRWIAIRRHKPLQHKMCESALYHSTTETHISTRMDRWRWASVFSSHAQNNKNLTLQSVGSSHSTQSFSLNVMNSFHQFFHKCWWRSLNRYRLWFWNQPMENKYSISVVFSHMISEFAYIIGIEDWIYNFYFFLRHLCGQV